MVVVLLAALLFALFYRSRIQKGEDYYAKHGLTVIVLSNGKGAKISVITNANDGYFGIIVDLELYIKVLKEVGFTEEARYRSTSYITSGGASSLPIEDPPLVGVTKHIVLYVEGDFRTPFRGFIRQYLGIGKVDYSRYCKALHATDGVPCTTWLMLNQDFPPDANSLRSIDVILTKTAITKSLLEAYLGPVEKPRIIFTKHSSLRAPAPETLTHKNFSLFLHYNRGSIRKNSAMVYRAWMKHPEWPTLVFVHPQAAWMQAHHGPNMVVHSYLSTEEMEALAARAGVWVCMSSTEGYGHYINEGRAAGALIMTPDVPPMNELGTVANGVTVPVKESDIDHEGYLHIPSAKISISHVEDGVAQILALSAEERELRARQSRKAFEDDYKFLLQTIRDAVFEFLEK